VILQASFLSPNKFITSRTCSPDPIIIKANIIYQNFPAPKKAFPIKAVSKPITVNVIPSPIENISEYLNAFLLSLTSLPWTYPINNGIDERVHGLKEATNPAKNDSIMAKNILLDMTLLK